MLKKLWGWRVTILGYTDVVNVASPNVIKTRKLVHVFIFGFEKKKDFYRMEK